MAETLENGVKSFLAAINYTYSNSDDWMLTFCIDKVTNTIKNNCNVSSIPEGLWNVAVQMVAGEFLSCKKNSGQFDGFSEINFEAVAKQIQEGDTNITFAFGEGNSTPEQRINTLIGYLQTSGTDEFVTYRKLKW